MVALEEEIARAIVGALPSRLILPLTSLTTRHTADSTANDWYLLGDYNRRKRAPENVLRAIDYYQQAIHRDSSFALAYSGLANAYVGAGNLNYLARAEAYPKARAAATRALALDSTLAEAHSSLGRVFFSADWNWEAANREFMKALKLNPSLVEARESHALLLAVLGHFDEAIQEAAQARRVDRLSSSIYPGSALMVAHRREDAIRDLQRVAALEPSYAVGWSNLARALINAGRFEEAVTAITQAMAQPRGKGGLSPGILVYAQYGAGRKDTARELLSQLEGQSGQPNTQGGLAFAYLGIGEKKKAVDAFIAAVEGREVNPLFVADPVWDAIRSDPRVVALRRELRLPD